jgi:serpin B
MIKHRYFSFLITFVLLLNLLPPFIVTASSGITEIQNNGLFTLRLLKEANPEYDQNVGIAPHSITTVLGMLLAGSGGTTHQEIHMQGCFKKGDTETHKELSLLNRQMEETNSTSKQTLAMANGLFISNQNGHTIEPDYEETLIDYYDGEIFEAKGHNTLNEINGWVNKKTHEKIPKMLDSLSPTSVCVLLNAFYFKGIWETPFDNRQTRQDRFNTLQGGNIETPFMQYEGELRTAESTQYQAVSIPFKDSLSMAVVLPKEGISLSQVEEQLEKGSLQCVLNDLAKSHPSKIDLKLPKWTQSFDYNLVPILKKMGINKVFEPDADLTKMSSQKGICVTDVKHKTYIDINEEGAEAAAATSGEINEAYIVPQPFYVNKPFLYYIVDNENGCIHFAGRTVNPQETQ